MATQLKPYQPAESNAGPRRAAWRQRLVEAERGITQGVRNDSAFFVHFFLGSVVVAAGFVLGISLIEWTAVVISLTLVLSAEMFQQVLKSILSSVGHHFDEPVRKSLRIGTAAVFVAMTGALIVIGLVFGHHLLMMFSDS